MHYEPKVSTGSLREKLIVRSSSRRSSVRNTISRALKNTFGIGDKHDNSKLTSSRESLPTTSSIQPSSSSEGSTSYFTTQSSGFCSMTHLPPPVQKKATHYASSLMSQSMYEPRSSASPKDVFRRHGSRSSAFPVHEDFDDSQSIVSTASTSRFITAHPRRVKKHCLHSFLLSPVRLRKREVTTTDAVEAGFVPPSAVPRCHSTNSLAFNGSQFQPKSISYSQDVLPLPPSSPRHNSAQRASRHDDMRSISTNDVHYRPGVEYHEVMGSDSRLCRMSASPITSRRRSLVPVPVHNSPALSCQEMRHPSSSSKKVAVAPQQYIGRAESHSANRQAMVATHHVAPMQRKSSNPMPNERLVDGGSLRTREDEQSSLNQRVKFLESELRRITKTQTASPTAYPMPYGGVATQPELAIILSEKNMKIEDLTHQVEHLNAQLRHEQRVYQKKVEELKRDRQTARAELDSFVKKLDHLSDRYVKYDKDLEEKYSKLQEDHAKAVAQLNEKERILSDLQNNVVRYEETTDFVGKQNNELHEMLDAREKEVDELREEIKHLQLDLDHKDKKINDQNGTIATLSAEASSHVSTSSGSAPQGFDDDEDSSSASFNRTHRLYSKAHSTLGVSPGNGLYQERTNLRKSLSNFALNAIKSDVVTAGMSQNLRKERATIAECRMLNVALKDALKCLQKRDNRMIPSILSILKKAEETDFANSDEDEGLQTDSRVMTVGEAETYVAQKLRALKELHGDLEQMRETTIDILETSQDANFF